MPRKKATKPTTTRGTEETARAVDLDAGAGGERVSATAVMVMVGLDRTRFNELKLRGAFYMGSDGKYDLAGNVRKYIAHLREVASGRGGNAGEQLSIQRAALAKEQGDAKKMENDVRRGELIEASRVIDEYNADLGDLRASLYQIPGTIGHEAATLGPGDLARRVQEAIDDALMGMRDGADVLQKVKADQMGAAEGRA